MCSGVLGRTGSSNTLEGSVCYFLTVAVYLVTGYHLIVAVVCQRIIAVGYQRDGQLRRRMQRGQIIAMIIRYRIAVYQCNVLFVPDFAVSPPFRMVVVPVVRVIPPGLNPVILEINRKVGFINLTVGLVALRLIDIFDSIDQQFYVAEVIGVVCNTGLKFEYLFAQIRFGLHHGSRRRNDRLLFQSEEVGSASALDLDEVVQRLSRLIGKVQFDLVVTVEGVSLVLWRIIIPSPVVRNNPVAGAAADFVMSLHRDIFIYNRVVTFRCVSIRYIVAGLVFISLALVEERIKGVRIDRYDLARGH